MTSLAKPFIDVALISCWLNSYSQDEVFETGVCHNKMGWAIFAWYLPFHIRFWQCINKWWVTGDTFPHFVNATKYFASILVILSNYFLGKDPSWKSTMVSLYFFSTVYSYLWDLIMDWGMFRDSRLLRTKILYPPRYYYFSCVTNFFLRFAWVLPLFPTSLWPETFKSIEGMTLFLAIVEIYRRAQWSLFRLENENINNFEKYRTILEIPRLVRE